MGLSSSKQKTTSNQTATVAPSAYSSPYIDSAAASLKPAFDAAQANINTLTPRVNSVLDFYGNTLSQPLTSNPYLDQIISTSNDNITNRVSGQFSQAGRYGSGAYSGTLARALAENEGALRYQDYSAQQQRQSEAARGILAGTGISAALPQAAAGTYADQIRALLGGYTTGTQNGSSTTKNSPSILGMLMSNAASAASAGAF